MRFPSPLGATALIAAAAVVLTGCASSSSDDVDDFPTSDIRIMAAFAAGGSSDLTARTLAPLLAEQLGVDVVVENRPGASGSINFKAMVSEKPDGYTISTSSVELATLQFLGFDIDPADYDMIGQAIYAPGALAVKADSPYETLDDFLDAAASEPGTFTYGTPGPGSGWEAVGMGLGQLADVELQPVPFDGNAPSVAAAIAGDVDATIAGLGEIRAGADSGDLRILTLFDEERNADFPDVPTATELGYDMVVAAWTGFMAPKGTPESILEKLEAALEVAVADERFTSVIENAGFYPQFRDREEARTFLDEETKNYGPWLSATAG